MTSVDTWPPVAITGTGSYLPQRVVTNAELVASGLDTTDAWIVERTGIRERRWAADDEPTSALATRAARAALIDAGVHADEVDLLVLATATPDWSQPATASAVHDALDLRGDCGAFDLGAVCSGFVYALHAGSSMLAAAEGWTTALVVAADRYSGITEPADRATRVFFGDGAGAVVLRKHLEVTDIAAMAAASAGIDLGGAFETGIDGGPLDEATPGIRSVAFAVDHSGKDAIIVPAGERWFRMNGPAVRAYAVPALVGAVREACRSAGIDVGELSLLVPHQSNRRIIEAAIDDLGLPEGDVAITVERTGNTAGASIAIALDEAARAGRIERGDLICLAGYGGGLQSAACVVRWGD